MMNSLYKGPSIEYTQDLTLNLGLNLAASINQNKGVFNLDLINVQEGKYTISVDNLLGQEVYSEIRNVIHSSSSIVNLSNLTKGVYMINIENNDTSINRKIIIE